MAQLSLNVNLKLVPVDKVFQEYIEGCIESKSRQNVSNYYQF